LAVELDERQARIVGNRDQGGGQRAVAVEHTHDVRDEAVRVGGVATKTELREIDRVQRAKAVHRQGECVRRTSLHLQLQAGTTEYGAAGGRNVEGAAAAADTVLADARGGRNQRHARRYGVGAHAIVLARRVSPDAGARGVLPLRLDGASRAAERGVVGLTCHQGGGHAALLAMPSVWCGSAPGRRRPDTHAAFRWPRSAVPCRPCGITMGASLVRLLLASPASGREADSSLCLGQIRRVAEIPGISLQDPI